MTARIAKSAIFPYQGSSVVILLIVLPQKIEVGCLGEVNIRVPRLQDVLLGEGGRVAQPLGQVEPAKARGSGSTPRQHGKGTHSRVNYDFFALKKLFKELFLELTPVEALR